MPSQSRLSSSFSRSNHQFTSTPNTSSFASSPPVPPVTEDLVVALHDFVALTPASNACLSFKSGQVIRVYNRDRSGWWDGEIILDFLSGPSASNTITRGWFPSNYVTTIVAEQRPSLVSSSSGTTSSAELLSPEFSNQSMIPGSSDLEKSPTFESPQNFHHALPENVKFNTFIQPIMEAISLLEGEIHHDRLHKVQPATAYIISAVRSVLDLTNCLNRDSPLLKTHPQLGRERKQVLSALACLVHKARKATGHDSTTTARDDTYANEQQLLDTSELRLQMKSILKQIDRVLAHVRRFLFVAQRCGIPLPARVPLQLNFEDLIASSPQQAIFNYNPCARGSEVDPHSPAPSTRSFHNVASQKNSFYSRKRSGSLKSTASSVSSLCQDPTNSIHTSVCSATQMFRLAEQSHDQVLSAVAVFIGHAHLHSRTAHPSSHAHLIDMTRDVIEKVRAILVLVECVFKRGKKKVGDMGNFQLLAEAREELYIATTSLVTAARVVTSGPSEESSLTGDEELDALLVSATSVLRAANDCMGALSNCLFGSDSDNEQYEVEINALSSHVEEGSIAAPAIENEMSDLRKDGSLPITNPKRAQHTLSMLSRKAGALTLARNQFSPEDFTEWSSILSNELQLSPTGITQSSAGGETENGSNAHRQTHANASSVEALAPLLAAATGARPPSPMYQEDRRDPRYRSGSSGSSDGRLSRDSSPPTSTSASHTEDEITRSSEYYESVKHIARGVSDKSHSAAQDILAKISFNMEGHVTGGTLRALVARMTLHDSPVEATFSHTFFMTFRMFSTPTEVTHALIARFNLTFPREEVGSCSEDRRKVQVQRFTPIRLRVYNVFKCWLENHWRTEADAPALSVILEWADTQLASVLPGPAERLADLAQKRLNESRSSGQVPSYDSRSKAKKGNGGTELQGTPPAPICSKSLMTQLRQGPSGSTGISLLDFDPMELARQITLIESNVYCAIGPEEILGQQFSKKPESAVNVRTMSGISTKMTGWITETILNEYDPRKRAQILKFWIKLGNKLTELQNYNALMSVMSALNSSTITRLKKTWEGIGSKSRALYESMNKALSHNRNYAEYRAKLRKAQTPCIPFLGVYLTDMTFCHEGNPTKRASPLDPNLKLINFDRYQKMAKIVIEIERFQVPFNLTEVPEIVSFIQNALENLVHKGSADILYQRSLILEPRESNHHIVVLPVI
ncbi:ras guanine nucleotide exchange factor domain-containing protein [Phakopsora pachyrhizi]|nr:ras guanine nucleotide exchange factor domain-containing protein [Phakopsora pachyrhizi]